LGAVWWSGKGETVLRNCFTQVEIDAEKDVAIVFRNYIVQRVTEME
jgi:hypothetical protein